MHSQSKAKPQLDYYTQIKILGYNLCEKRRNL